MLAILKYLVCGLLLLCLNNFLQSVRGQIGSIPRFGTGIPQSGVNHEFGANQQNGINHEFGTNQQSGVNHEFGANQQSGVNHEFGANQQSGVNHEFGTNQQSGVNHEFGTNQQSGVNHGFGANQQSGINFGFGSTGSQASVYPGFGVNPAFNAGGFGNIVARSTRNSHDGHSSNFNDGDLHSNRNFNFLNRNHHDDNFHRGSQFHHNTFTHHNKFTHHGKDFTHHNPTSHDEHVNRVSRRF